MPLHPVIAALLAQFAAAGRPPISGGTPEMGRALMAAGRAGLGPASAIGPVETIAVPGRSGSVATRLFRPAGTPKGLIVYLHGGGWVVGGLDDFDILARTLVALTGRALLLPDYRLAPEHPFPAGLEDAEDVLLHAHGARDRLAGAGLPLVVAGDSAGGNLATVAARRLGRRVDLAAQVLIYPVADCDFDRPSYEEHDRGLLLSRADMRWFFGHYAPPEIWGHPDISPLRGDDLGGLPPTMVLTAEYDVLRDEGEAYAARLAAAGVPTLVTRRAGLTHGFLRLHNHIDTVRAALDEIAAFIAAPPARPA